MTSRRPSILNRSSMQTQTELPMQEDQIRGYRQMARNRHQVARTTRRVFGRNNYNRTLKTAVDPERQLEISRERRANLIPVEVLYSNNRSTARHRHIHLGIFMIRLHALHRKSTETNALVVLRDTRWEDSQQIVAAMEVDLSAGMQLVYTFPDMILSVNDFHNHVEVAIQTRGYDTWQGAESNLLITMALTSKLSNTSYMGFQYSVENVVDHLTTNGITAILGERRSIDELEGMSRNLNLPEQISVREKWSTLGEPSGKWHYYVRYDVPINTTPIEEIAATGWGEEFSDDEVTPGKVTILNEAEEESDWDDDERSGRKNLVIQEKLAQNQQDFLDEYLPQWDDQLATQKQESELEWENPFAAKHGEDHTILHLSKEEENNNDFPYPKFETSKKWQRKSLSNMKNMYSHPLHKKNQPKAINPYMIQSWGHQSIHQCNRIHNHSIGQATSLVILKEKVNHLVEDMVNPCLWSEVIFRWESITIDRLNNQTWSDNKAKLAFVENLLGESEKLMWQQWRTVFPEAYYALKAIADEPQNKTSQVRQLILLEDPYRGSTDEQDRAYRDLDKITYEETKNLWSFLEDFRQLATKSRRLYFPSTTEKLFAKLSPSLSKKIEESFRAKYPGLNSGVLPAIKFTHTFVSEMCKDMALAKELRDLSLCSAIPIPGYYKNNRKKYGMRKSRAYKGKPHNSHVKPFKRKYNDDRGRVKKCKCFICRKEGHFAKDCRSKQGNIARSAVYQELDLDDNWDIISADFDDSSVYSLSKGEGDTHQNISVMVQDTPVKEIAFIAIEEDDESDSDQEEDDYQPNHHTFMFHPGPPKKIAEMVQVVGSWKPNKELPIKSKEFNVKGKQPQKLEEEKNFSNGEVKLLKELLKEKTEQVQQMIRDQAKEYYEKKALRIEKERLEEQKDEEIKKLKAQLQKRKEEVEVQFSEEEFPPLGSSQIARPFMEAEIHHFRSTTTNPKVRKITNQLYNVKVEFDIPDCSAFGTTAIIDTGASTCFGANFLRFMKGGIRIEGDEITIYKKVTKIKTSNQTEIAEIDELEVNEEEFLEINESIYFNQKRSKAFLEQFKPVIERLKHQRYIREQPLKHWKKNGELCKLDIINPDITIEDRPLKHVTLAMEDSFKRHVDSLLKIGAIRPSKSRHRTMAMIVNSGTTIDPVTGKEVKGKERMVFNYKSLNDNTYKDQYSLPGINMIIKRIGGAKIFSKFDLKAGFHQVAMDEESIPWTVFLVPGGLYEWLVMPFGLKNAPAHLERMLKIYEDNGLVLSPTKTKIAVSTIDFLGAVIGEGTINLQPHIIKKIVNFNEEELKMKKGLRKIKEQVQNLPDLEIPPENAYIILETDGCMEGCGGIVKWKKKCTGEMKELAAAALYSVDEVLQDWDATTYNFLEDDVSNDDNKYRYNRKGFLEDDDTRSDDSIFIVDPGWDDYCLQ
nr:TPA: orf y [Tanacetum cinerariifolium]